eukprot:GHVR01028582.1.p1 GENE.GHVR01028582.1~~GHVR01028582.1.p1  ORF type:complete len:297 (+),score=26.96 GHVR01028582.1:241-1131(+)
MKEDAVCNTMENNEDMVEDTPFYKNICSDYYSQFELNNQFDPVSFIDLEYGSNPTKCIVIEKYIFDINTYLFDEDSEKKKLQEKIILTELNYQKFIIHAGFALLTLHKNNIIHMNVKMENFLVKLENEELVMHLSGLESSHKKGDNSINEDKSIDMNIMPREVVYNLSSLGLLSKPLIQVGIDYYSFSIVLAKMCFNIKKNCIKSDCSELIKDLDKIDKIDINEQTCSNSKLLNNILRKWIKKTIRGENERRTTLDFIDFLYQFSIKSEFKTKLKSFKTKLKRIKHVETVFQRFAH